MNNKKKIIVILLSLLIVLVILSVITYFAIVNKKCVSSKDEALIKIKNKYGEDLKYEFVNFKNEVFKYQVQLETQRNYYTLDIKTCEIDVKYILNDDLYEKYK